MAKRGKSDSGTGTGTDEPAPTPAAIEPIEIQEEMERSFLEYSMSVIVSRALPDVRDGLKPVHRRILYSMYEQGLRPDRSRTKCAKAVGEVMGNFHPHGDTAIYDALQATYQQALNDRKKQPGYYPSIVLMTDGESSSGSNFEAFRNWYQALPDTAQDIPVFTIMFGDADSEEMKSLAELTGGRVFDAGGSSLSAVFKEIRGYQ